MRTDAASLPLPDLIKELAEALRTYDRLAFDEEYDHKLGDPCSERKIASLEATFGRPLPPSYRAFLNLHNGWSDFAGDAKLLAVEDHATDLVEETLGDLMEVFSDLDQPNPFEQGGFPVMLGEDSDQVLYIDPQTTRPDGEMDFVFLDLTTEEARFPDFASFLAHKLDLLRAMIDDEVLGVSDKDDDEEST